MLLTIRTTYRPATDLGFLLHKHPEHVHTREFPFGIAAVFYPEATEEACTAGILLDVDPVGMVRGRGGKGGAEDQYVNDRPYVASSLGYNAQYHPVGDEDAQVGPPTQMAVFTR